LQQNGRAPKAETLAQGLEAYYAEGQASIYKCPDVSEGTSYGANKFVHQMLDDTFKVILLDAKESPIPFDDETSEEWREKVDPRHSGTFNVLYFDGHVEKQVAFGIDPYVESAKNKWMWEPNRYKKDEDCDCPNIPAVAGGLVAHYTFDEPTAMGMDSSGTGHNATYLPAKVKPVEDPERCFVAKFMYDSEAGVVAGSPIFNISPPVMSGVQGWTIAYWWKCDGAGEIFSGNIGNSQFGHVMVRNRGMEGTPLTTMQSGMSTGEDIVNGKVASPAKWQHFVASLSISDRKLYSWVDGVPATKDAVWNKYVQNLQSSAFAGLEWPYGVPFPGFAATGHFDDLRIYHRVLTDAEAKAIYEDGMSKTTSTSGCGG
jgi:prepilin-type processing-associated H-X9-DG protein